MVKKTKSKSVAHELRQAIAKAERGGMTRYRIAKLAGVPASQVARVADGDRVPRLDTAEKIAAAIGLRVKLESSAR